MRRVLTTNRELRQWRRTKNPVNLPGLKEGTRGRELADGRRTTDFSG